MSSYYLLQSFMFYVPVLTIFLNSELNNLLYVSILFSAKSITVFLLEIPTGYISDHISRKRSIIIGTILYIVSMLIFVICPNFVFLFIAQVIFGVAETLSSGSDQALFFDNFRHIGKEDYYQKYYANLTFVSMIIVCTSFVLGGMAYSFNKKSVFLLTAIFMAISMVFLIPLKEYPYKTDELEAKLSISSLLEKAKLIRHESMWFKFFLFFGSIAEAAILSVYLYLIPIMLQKAQVPSKYFGIIYAVSAILYGLGTKMTSFFAKFIKNIMLPLILISMLFMVLGGVNSVYFIILSVGVFRLLWGGFDLIFRTRLNSELKNSSIRATSISISNSITNAASTIFVLAFGCIIDNFTYRTLLVAVSILFLILSVFVMFVKRGCENYD